MGAPSRGTACSTLSIQAESTGAGWPGRFEREIEQHRPQVSKNAGLNQAAMHIAGQQHPLSGPDHGQQCGLQQSGGPVDPVPATGHTHLCGGVALTGGDGAIRLQRTAEGWQFRQVPNASALAEQSAQSIRKRGTSAMSGQKQGVTEAACERGQTRHGIRLISLKSLSLLSAKRCDTTPGGIWAGCVLELPSAPVASALVLTGLVLVLLLRGGSSDPDVQKGLARRILNTLTGLGPCFIKLGQALSTRPDLVRRDWLEELTRLQDDLPAFPHSIALACIREELGAPAEELFEEFPDTPIAAASLGQVYKARLQGQHWVAVKVQRPNLIFILRRDLVLIRAIGVLTAPLLPLNLGFGLGGIIDEFGRSLFEEIDYGQEAANAEKFSALFADNDSVYIPKVERMLSATRVLTTTWIDGAKMRDSDELRSQRLDPTALIRTGVICGLQQLLEFGYFHADPHPGNLFALPVAPAILAMWGMSISA